MGLEIHPLADIFPYMSGEEWNLFLTDVQTNGLQKPITMHEGKIVDGRNRYKAVQELGIEGRFEEWIDPGCGLKAWIVSQNLHRRHLDASQKGLLTAKLARFDKGGVYSAPREGRPSGKTPPNGGVSGGSAKDLREAAALTGASARLSERGARILRDAPQLSRVIEDGKLKLTTAERILNEAPELIADVANERLSAAQAIDAIESKRDYQAKLEEISRKSKPEIERLKNETVEDHVLQNVWLEIHSKFKRMQSKEFGMQKSAYNARVLKNQDLDSMIEFLCDVRSWRDGDKVIVIDVGA